MNSRFIIAMHFYIKYGQTVLILIEIHTNIPQFGNQKLDDAISEPRVMNVNI